MDNTEAPGRKEQGCRYAGAGKAAAPSGVRGSRKGGKGREGISLSAIYALVVSSLEREGLSAASNTAACGASFSKMKSGAK
jgi:hypothetical protein